MLISVIHNGIVKHNSKHNILDLLQVEQGGRDEGDNRVVDEVDHLVQGGVRHVSHSLYPPPALSQHIPDRMKDDSHPGVETRSVTHRLDDLRCQGRTSKMKSPAFQNFRLVLTVKLHFPTEQGFIELKYDNIFSKWDN